MSLPTLLTGASLASALYLAFSPRVNTVLYRNLLFYPVPFPRDYEGVPNLEGIDGEEVWFDSGSGQKIHGFFWKNPRAQFVVLFHHGNSGNITIRHFLARLLTLAGCSVLVYDYQGFGKSSGKPTVDGICGDGTAAYDYLVNSVGFAPEQVILYGESLGAAVATHVSTVRTSAGIILQSGFASLRRIAIESFPILVMYPTALFPMPTLDSMSILSRPHPPVLFIHGDLDQVIPVHHTVDMYAAAVGKKSFLRLPQTGHGDISSSAPDQYVSAIKKFIGELDSTSALLVREDERSVS
jgi:Dipeptidyl aminopeptidases/acylaminoacyl-peptidases